MNPECLNLSNKKAKTFRWIRGQKSGYVRASQKGDHYCCAESLELVLHAVGSLKDVFALQTEKCQGGHGNGEAKLPETLSRSFKNPDLIILISCTELSYIYSLAVVCDSVCVCVSILFGMSYVFSLAPFCSWCRTSSSNSRTKTCLVFSFMRKTLSDFLLVQDIWVTHVTDFSLNMDKPDGHWCVVAFCLPVNSLDELQRCCWWSQGAASTSKKEGESSQKGADSSHAKKVLLLWHQRRQDGKTLVLFPKGWRDLDLALACFGIILHYLVFLLFVNLNAWSYAMISLASNQSASSFSDVIKRRKVKKIPANP